MKINAIGPMFSTSGYSNHFRGLINALDKVADVKITTQLMDKWELQCNDAELRNIQKPDTKDRINLIIDMPFNWGNYCNKKYNVAFLVFEGDKIPVSWIDNIKDKRINQVWVPSTHVYNAIKNTMSDGFERQLFMQKIKIVPHGVELKDFYPKEVKKDKFTFLVNKGFRNDLDRGGVQHAIRAFVEEFGKPEARLLLKLNPAYAMPPQMLISYINKVVSETGKTKEDLGEIAFIYDNMNKQTLNDLYNSCNVLLNPTEGEAFSLPCIESMACGKIPLATAFGGQCDFIKDKINGFLIDGAMHEIKHEIIYEGISWCKINLDELKKKMRWCYENQDKVKDMGIEAIKTAQDWTWENSSLKAVEFLEQLD